MLLLQKNAISLRHRIVTDLSIFVENKGSSGSVTLWSQVGFLWFVIGLVQESQSRSREIQSKNDKLVCENAVTGLQGCCSLLVMGCCPQLFKSRAAFTPTKKYLLPRENNVCNKICQKNFERKPLHSKWMDFRIAYFCFVISTAPPSWITVICYGSLFIILCYENRGSATCHKISSKTGKTRQGQGKARSQRRPEGLLLFQ